MIRDASIMDRPVRRRRVNPRIAALVVAAVVVVIAAVVAWPRVSGWFGSQASVDVSRLRIAEVVRGDLVRDVSVQGRVVAAWHPTLFSPADGTVRLQARAGDVVAAGDVLAVVESPELGSRLRQERSTLASLEADLERKRIEGRQDELADRQAIDLARVELDAAERAMARAERSRAEGILNEVEYEEAVDDLSRARLVLEHAIQDAGLRSETAEFELRQAELGVERQRLVADELSRQVGELTVRAPVAGLVSRLDVNDHDAVVLGAPLVTVVDLGEFEIEILVPESYADELAPGSDAVVTVDGVEWPAAVKAVAPEVEGSQVRGTVAFAGESPEGLRQNQRVTTRLVFETRPDVLKVPRGPFIEGGAGRRVFVVSDGFAESRPVRLGASSIAEVEILEGLDEGERIIVSDTSRFEDAKRLYLRR